MFLVRDVSRDQFEVTSEPSDGMSTNCQRLVKILRLKAGAERRSEIQRILGDQTQIMKVVVAEKISSSAVDLLREPRWTIVTADQLDGKLAAQLESADALIVRSAVQVNAELLEHAHKLRVIGRAGVGVDNIDLDAATRKGIAVMNTPGANAIAVAEHTLALMLAMARHIGRANELMHAGKWEKKSLQGTELRGKTVGIVGLGRVGMEVARRARAFGMEVVAHDPFVSTAVAKEQGIRMAKLEEVYAAADYLSLHVGLTPQTAGMINAESIKKMKQGVQAGELRARRTDRRSRPGASV